VVRREWITGVQLRIPLHLALASRGSPYPSPLTPHRSPFPVRFQDAPDDGDNVLWDHVDAIDLDIPIQEE
jgi:hypothetical protein